MKSYVLETALFPGSHAAGNIAEKVRDCLRKFKIPDSMIVACVHDEAANAMAAGRILQTFGWSNQPCSAHLLQTAVRHTISSSRSVQKLLSASRKLVGHFKHSNIATEQLEKKQAQLCQDRATYHLVQDVTTRWNSSYYMLQRLVQLRLPVTAVLTDASAKKDEKLLLLKDKEWTLAESLVDVLAPAEAATRFLSGQQYVTSSVVLPLIVGLLVESKKADSDKLKSFQTTLASGLENKFSLASVTASSPLLISAAIDPRFRSLHFASALSMDSTDIKAAVEAEANRLVPTVRADESISKQATAEELEPKAKRNVWDMLADDGDTKEEHDGNTVAEEATIFFSERQVRKDENPLEWWKSNSGRQTGKEHSLCTCRTGLLCLRCFSQ